jgi:hypothetical protein
MERGGLACLASLLLLFPRAVVDPRENVIIDTIGGLLHQLCRLLHNIFVPVGIAWVASQNSEGIAVGIY